MPDNQGIGELVELVKSYAKQETLGPLKGAGRWAGYGLAGSVLMIIGLIVLSVALLRVLQTETGTTFVGNWSWVPHAITFVVVLAVIALLASRIPKRTL